MEENIYKICEAIDTKVVNSESIFMQSKDNAELQAANEEMTKVTQELLHELNTILSSDIHFDELSPSGCAFIETEIFGHVVKNINYEAAEFLLANTYPESLNLFKQELNSRNIKRSSSVSLELSRSVKSDPLMIKLGRCGYIPKIPKFNTK